MLITQSRLRKEIRHFLLKSVGKITHAQNIVCNKTRLDCTTHEQTISCRQLFASCELSANENEEKDASNDKYCCLGLEYSYLKFQYPISKFPECPATA